MTLYFTPRQLECPGTVAGCGMIDPPPKRVNVSSPTISAAIAQPAHAAFAKTQAVALAPKAATAFANPFGAHTEFDLTRHALKTSLGLQLYIRRHAPGLSVTQG